MRKFATITFEDVDFGDRETKVVSVEEEYFDKVDELIKAYDEYYSGLQYMDCDFTYDEFVEVNDTDNELIKEHFDTFNDKALVWSVDTFIELFNAVYTDAFMKEEKIKEFYLSY